MNKVIYIALNRCIYCRACIVACEREHEGYSHMSVMPIKGGRAVPMHCRHCEKHPCLVACPTGAITREGTGPVIIHGMKCIGCRLCAMVCPFGVLNLDVSSRIMRKCDLCIHRLNDGRNPACVTTCPSRALVFDEFDAIMSRMKIKAAQAAISGVGLQT
ncbi:MAG TPA: 4Fe-4S dicluster domain-containing protein [Acidobacteriota bacterium]|nr:4Fe-4S dicluster domain-containing protein [Acidobacteriota bacterium]